MRKIKGRRICIICEGDEEEEYIKALLKKNVFSDKYNFSDPINVKSFFNIFPRYNKNFNRIHMI